MPCPCRSPAMPCRKGLECVVPIWFTQCGRVWFTLAMPCSDHAVRLKATAQHDRRKMAVLWPWEERHGRSMAWQVWIRHGRTVQIKWERYILNPQPHGTAWARHAMCEYAVRDSWDSWNPKIQYSTHKNFSNLHVLPWCWLAVYLCLGLNTSKRVLYSVVT